MPHDNPYSVLHSDLEDLWDDVAHLEKTFGPVAARGLRTTVSALAQHLNRYITP